jgi:hypothetical protein
MNILFYLAHSTVLAITLNTAVNFTPGSVDTTQSSFTATANSVVANGVDTANLTFTARDIYRNVVPNISVSFTASGSGAAFAAVSGSTGPNGIFATTVSSTVAQSKVLTATYGTGASANANVVFVPGPASASTSTVTVAPATQVADGNYITVSLLLQDAQYNKITGVKSSFSSPVANANVPVNQFTDSAGNASMNYSSTQAGNFPVHVSAGGLNFDTTLSFIPGPISSSSSFFVANPNVVAADGNSQASLIVYLADAKNNPIPSTMVAFSNAGGAGKCNGPSALTNNQGFSYSSLASFSAGPQTLFASSKGSMFSTQVSFTNRSSFCNTTNNYSSITGVTGTTPLSIDHGDFNRDGYQDLAFVNYAGTSMSVALNNSTGGFNTPVKYTTKNGPYDLAITDINVDGLLDIITVNYYGNTVSVFIGNGDGTFKPQVTYPVSTNSVSITSADFNEDGLPDIATVSGYNKVLSIHLNKGAGILAAPVTYAQATAPAQVRYGDFDQDGHQDLVLVNRSANTISVLKGSGTGSFSNLATYSTGNSPSAVTVTDFDADGYQDLAVVNYTDKTVNVFFGAGSGSFALGTSFSSAGNAPDWAVAEDFNGDGRPDIAVADNANNFISMFINQGNHNFASAVNYNVGGSVAAITTADFNKDSAVDFAAVANQPDSFVVFTYSGCN